MHDHAARRTEFLLVVHGHVALSPRWFHCGQDGVPVVLVVHDHAVLDLSPRWLHCGQDGVPVGSAWPRRSDSLHAGSTAGRIEFLLVVHGHAVLTLHAGSTAARIEFLLVVHGHASLDLSPRWLHCGQEFRQWWMYAESDGSVAVAERIRLLNSFWKISRNLSLVDQLQDCPGRRRAVHPFSDPSFYFLPLHLLPRIRPVSAP